MKRLGKFFILLLSIFILLYGIIWCTPFRRSLPGYHSFFYSSEDYKKECVSLQEISKHLSCAQKDSLLRNAVSEKLFPYWEGTRWGFNGTTEIPGEGKIACGYFVTTLLRDCGIELDRVRLARMGSEEMIEELVTDSSISRYSHVDLQKFIADIKTHGDNLYVLGLDTHVGFLVCEKGTCWFIHSSGGYPWCVVKEQAEKCAALEHSNYRVAGRVTGDEKFLARWKE